MRRCGCAAERNTEGIVQLFDTVCEACTRPLRYEQVEGQDESGNCFCQTCVDAAKDAGLVARRDDD